MTNLNWPSVWWPCRCPASTARPAYSADPSPPLSPLFRPPCTFNKETTTWRTTEMKQRFIRQTPDRLISKLKVRVTSMLLEVLRYLRSLIVSSNLSLRPSSSTWEVPTTLDSLSLKIVHITTTPQYWIINAIAHWWSLALHPLLWNSTYDSKWKWAPCKCSLMGHM